MPDGAAYLSTREVQGLLLELLVAFDGMCGQHGIRYSLDSGTLLGAVRHGGFIPWDDDVDVIVPRPDYERLLAHPEWVPQPLYIDWLGRSGSGYFLPFAKLVDPRWRAQEPAFVGVWDECLWLDIFPVDAVPDDDAEMGRLLKRQRRLELRASRSVVNFEATTRGRAKLLAKRLLFPLYRRAFPHRGLFERMARNAEALRYGTTSTVANVSWGDLAPKRIPVGDFDALAELGFEGHPLKAVPCWDGLLTQLYGDYMRLPPVGERVTHGTRVWRAPASESISAAGGRGP